jgi:hypothetical protein
LMPIVMKSYFPPFPRLTIVEIDSPRNISTVL